MASSGSSASSPNLVQLSSPSSSTPDRRSADVVMLAKPAQSAALTRVNSTPISQPSEDGKPASSSIQDASRLSLNRGKTGEDPSAMLTLAPPKPGPADTLYPSPSGGFVPSPEEGQDWRLKPPPKRREAKSVADSAEEPSNCLTPGRSTDAPSPRSHKGDPITRSTSSTPSSSLQHDLEGHPPSHSLVEGSRPSSTAPTRPPSIPASQQTASRIADASSASLSRRSSQASQPASSPMLRPLSTASSTTRRESGLSKNGSPDGSGSAESSGRRRRSGASAFSRKSDRPASGTSVNTTQQAEAGPAAPVVIRDFAFAETDPRFSGLREAGLLDETSRDYRSGHLDAGHAEEEGEWDLDEDLDEDEFPGDEGLASDLAVGVYRVLYEFISESEHELSVQPEDKVRVVGALDGGWAIVTKQADARVQGIVPASYLEWASED